MAKAKKRQNSTLFLRMYFLKIHFTLKSTKKTNFQRGKKLDLVHNSIQLLKKLISHLIIVLFVFKCFHGLSFEGSYLTLFTAPYVIKLKAENYKQQIPNYMNKAQFTEFTTDSNEK